METRNITDELKEWGIDLSCYQRLQHTPLEILAEKRQVETCAPVLHLVDKKISKHEFLLTKLNLSEFLAM